MRVLTPTEEESTLIDPLVQHFQTDLGGKRLISTSLNSVMNYVKESRELQELIHSTRFRIKEPDHLADKLVRKIRKCRDEGTQFDITTDNLFTAINDLAGIRLLHLHTTQMKAIDRCLRAIIEEQPVELVDRKSVV